MQKKLMILIAGFLLFPMFVYAYTPNTCVLGPGNGAPGGPANCNPSMLSYPCNGITGDNLSSTGKNYYSTWKFIRWPAYVDGRGGTADVYVLGVMMADMINGAQSYDCAYGIWSDNSGAVGSLMAWGYEIGHEFNPYTREYFDLNNVVTSRTVTDGTVYWIGWRSDISNNNSEHFERTDSGAVPTAVNCSSAGCMKRGGTDLTPDNYADTPSGNFNNILYNCPDYYGWTAWTASGATTTTSSASTSSTSSSTTTTIDTTPPSKPSGLTVLE